MSGKVIIGDGKGGGLKAHNHKRNGDNGLKVFTDDLHERQGRFLTAFNSSFGINMAINAAFSGTPDQVHDGLDTTLWTASNIVGTKVNFATTPPTGSTNGGDAVYSNRMSINDVFQFDKGSDLTIASYTAITSEIYVDSSWSVLDSVKLCCWDTGTNAQVGDAVFIEDYFSFATFDEWQTISVNFSDFNFSETTFDAIRFEQVVKSGQAPQFYLDQIQVEEASGSATFTMEPTSGTKAYIDQIYFSVADALDTTLLNASMPSLSYDKILGLSQLTNGITIRTIQDQSSGFVARITNLGDMLTGGGELSNAICDGTNTFINVKTDFVGPIILDSRTNDRIEFVLQDNLSGLISLIVFAKQRRQDIDVNGING